MHDFGSGFSFECGGGEQTDEIIAFDESPFVIEEETAVEIAVPRKTKIRAMLDDRP